MPSACGLHATLEPRRTAHRMQRSPLSPPPCRFAKTFLSVIFGFSIAPLCARVPCMTLLILHVDRNLLNHLLCPSHLPVQTCQLRLPFSSSPPQAQPRPKSYPQSHRLPTAPQPPPSLGTHITTARTRRRFELTLHTCNTMDSRCGRRGWLVRATK